MKPGTAVQVSMKPWESKESFENWMVHVKTNDFESEYLIPLAKKTRDNGKTICGWF
jgi:hypothetical protein